MRVYLRRDGLHVVLRFGEVGGRDAAGFVIKWRKRALLFSERHHGFRHQLRLGPIYFRTYARRGPSA